MISTYAGLAPQGTRLQSGTRIRRWNLALGKDEIVWDPFNFLDPLTERTNSANSDPAANSDAQNAFPCASRSMQIQEWMHGNSVQVAPSGVILMSVRHIDTVIAISPEFDRIAWHIGRFKSDFIFPNPNDRFYHEHYVRMLDMAIFFCLTMATVGRRLKAASTAARSSSPLIGTR